MENINRAEIASPVIMCQAKAVEVELVRARIMVRGIVQGVGFRPFIYRLANDHELKGWVLNSTEGVVIEVEGCPKRLEEFISEITLRAPPLAVIEKVETSLLPPVGYHSFIIQASREEEGKFVLISPDICICPDCLRELFDPLDRRYRYPFINCTNCGPRFTIIKDIPYDRPKTTMAVFQMCPSCEGEYYNPSDRRFHAQPNACPTCGPRVWLVNGRTTGDSFTEGDEAIRMARYLLSRGAIVAVKGLGGFHLACDATSSAAVSLLRERKCRVNKPFAIMSLDCQAVERYCHVNEAERQLLESPQRPIVLLRRKADSPISALVAPNNSYLGVMLPYTPLHYLLLERRGDKTDNLALVMTSGNMSEEPIAIGNEEALERLETLADAFLLHNRDIHVRCDDSVTRLFEGKEAIIRRSRSYAPFPVRLDFEMRQVLACGAELKNTFCLTRGNYAFLSQHIGDMENLETLSSFESGIEHFKRLFQVSPEVIAYDLHPEYLATKYAARLRHEGAEALCPEVQFVPVQHHHAHIASCLAENGLEEPVIGVAFDGTGYGEDGQIWGGEFLVGDFHRFKRRAHLKYVVLPGGEAAIRKPYRMAISYLFNLPTALTSGLTLFDRINPVELQIVRRQIERGINSPLTSSCGRLFDAVSSLLGICDVITYEGQAAIELEMLADESVEDGYHWPLPRGKFPIVINQEPILRDIIHDLSAGVPIAIISAKFHNAVAEMVSEVCCLIREHDGLSKVALSGGVFQNVYLLKRTLSHLRRKGFAPYIHHQVPCNDGGIALGQAVIANAKITTPKLRRSIYVLGGAG
ncbi:MAG: carbamoyltransferase HypF [Dehalococcoidales bacterium]|nr:carbamoyltransferase HypF [Dehalococcoidales bacterium]